MLNVKQEERKFLEHVSQLVTYWDEIGGTNQKDKLEGLAFSVLSSIDGCSYVGEYALIPADDNGGHECVFNLSNDIGGCLHEVFFEVHRKSNSKNTIDKETRKFLEHISDLVGYWDEIAGQNQKDKLEGLAFSILSTIDGCSCVGIYALIPSEYDGGEQCVFHLSNNISGCLHEMFYEVHRELSNKNSK